MGAAGILQIAGGLLGASTERDQGKAQQELLKFNARTLNDQAKDAITRGTESERRLREGASGLAGAQRASFAAQGVSLDTGSALEVQQDTARLAELDALQIRNNAALEAYGYKVQAYSSKYQSDVIGALKNKKFLGTLLGSSSGSLQGQQPANNAQQTNSAPKYGSLSSGGYS